MVRFLQRALRRRRPALAFAVATVVLAVAPATLAAGIDPTTLNPVPLASYVCTATGAGAVCRSHTIEPYSLEPTGIFCGSGASTVELLDSATRDVDATRWYDRDLDLVRRVRTFLFRDARLWNPATGATLAYTQHNTDSEILVVPGDLSAVTWTGHGHLSVTAPGSGAVIVSAGRTVVGPDGAVEFAAGPSQLDEYYGGNLDVVDQLCAALGSPRT